jgi:hypothetical protein
MRTALIQGMKNANKTRVRFGWRANGGFLEGAGRVPFRQLDARFDGTCQYPPTIPVAPTMTRRIWSDGKAVTKVLAPPSLRRAGLPRRAMHR